MNLDDPAWRHAPVRTSLKVAASLVRRSLPGMNRVAVRYDGGRSLISADLQTPLGLRLYRYGHRDPDIDLVARLLSPGDVFVDGGANVGLFTLVAARCVGPSGRVIAFEPGRTVRARLLENVTLNGFTQVDVLPFALSSAPGEAAFQEFEIGGAGLSHLAPTSGESGQVRSVALATLDGMVNASDRRRLRLIKLDLEGAEHAALQGAATLLAEAHPDLLLEVEPAHLTRMGSSPVEVAALLSALGYRFHRLGQEGSGLVLSAVADIAAPAAAPNVFATVDPDRVRARGVSVR